jgi:hypothetical protein
MPTRLRRLPAAGDTEAQRIAKLTEAIAPTLDPDVRQQVGAVSADDAAKASAKLQRALAESAAKAHDLITQLIDSSAAQFIHYQDVPAASWTIAHNLSGYPSVSVVDSANRLVFGEVTYLTQDTVRIDFSAGFSGRAYFVL